MLIEQRKVSHNHYDLYLHWKRGHGVGISGRDHLCSPNPDDPEAGKSEMIIFLSMAFGAIVVVAVALMMISREEDD